MVSINLSDFFHDMLIIQASRPVSPYGDQQVPKDACCSTGDFGPDQEPSKCPAGKWRCLGQFFVSCSQHMFLRMLNGQKMQSIGRDSEAVNES